MNMDSEMGPYRKLSFSIQLSNPNDYEGSELQINTGGPIYNTVPKEQGTLVAFPSFIMHKVTPLTRGKRYSLVAWIHGPNWK
jgi:PKHD-type hydroxylase